jgi:hypothetical protein
MLSEEYVRGACASSVPFCQQDTNLVVRKEGN